MQDITDLITEYKGMAQAFVQDEVATSVAYTANHFNTLLTNKLAGMDTSCKKWLFLQQLRSILEELKEVKEKSNTADVELANYYACLCAVGNEFTSLIPYLETNHVEDGDEFNGLEYAALEDRIDMVKNYLKKDGIKDQDVYEELSDLISYANYGKKRYAQLIIGMAAAMVNSEKIKEGQANTLCAILIVGDATKPLQYVLSMGK